ncbi:DNA-3-methyladenine glycosylase [Candidatus Berkiella aquae]|uniref:Putative 3-methyladenine DNA glycosylase n=1 Tax=Candidatus Berkiella aquae TaxID=295108 RepID=A0A0Q9YZL7_9GAMM|nr:DNA-3-methyladenine glycosylase [Candidatus Berkiella aquae]MCS5711579.1 DNA-3-methyladenine glycosylase [Candidatus Berkiella aquae]
MKPQKLPRDFYLSDDVVKLSQALLGKFIVTDIDGKRTAGMIVETEAYRGAEDRASHAFSNRRTKRTETMFQQGGVAYIYLCYGIHHLFNVVTAPQGTPHAVLVRAIEPVDGIDIMLQRRGMTTLLPRLTAGPGALTQALGITTVFDGSLLSSKHLWLEERGIQFSKKEIVSSPRIGIDYAKEHRDLPWRFRVQNNRWTSKAK